MVASINSIAVHDGLFSTGVALSSIALALEPEVLFEPVSLANSKRSGYRSHLVIAIASVGGVCLLLAGVAWLAS